jgi:FSR family fosmidomycin resistance protein-like MFS transporter
LSHALATPSLILLLLLPGRFIYLGAFFGGFFIMASLPLGVTMGQEIAPKGKSMVSSLMMGLAWGIGGMMTPLAGKLADAFSIRPVLGCLAVIPLTTLWLIAKLPDTRAGVLPESTVP